MKSTKINDEIFKNTVDSTPNLWAVSITPQNTGFTVHKLGALIGQNFETLISGNGTFDTPVAMVQGSIEQAWKVAAELEKQLRTKSSDKWAAFNHLN